MNQWSLWLRPFGGDSIVSLENQKRFWLPNGAMVSFLGSKCKWPRPICHCGKVVSPKSVLQTTWKSFEDELWQWPRVSHDVRAFT